MIKPQTPPMDAAPLPATPPRRPGLWRDERGQVTAVFGLMAFALVIFWVTLYDIGEISNQKVKTQDAADAASYAGGVWAARSLNLVAYTQRAVIANLLTMAQLVIARSHSKFFFDLGAAFGWIATVVQGIPIVGWIVRVIAEAIAAVVSIYEIATYALYTIGMPVLVWTNWFLLQVQELFFDYFCPPYGISPGMVSSEVNILLLEKTLADAVHSIDENMLVNPGFADDPLNLANILGPYFTYESLKSFATLVCRPAYKHQDQPGSYNGSTTTKSSWNKTIDQKYRQKWLVEELGRTRASSGIWGFSDRGLPIPLGFSWPLRITYVGDQNVDKYKDGMLKKIKIGEARAIIRLAAPEQVQNDNNMEATDGLALQYNKFWDFFDFPWKDLFKVGDGAWADKLTPPIMADYVPTGIVVFNIWKNIANARPTPDETGYKGLPHENNEEYVVEMPTMLGRGTGFFEVNNHKYIPNNQGDRVILDTWSWFSSNLPVYNYILDPVKVGNGGNANSVKIPEDPRKAKVLVVTRMPIDKMPIANLFGTDKGSMYLDFRATDVDNLNNETYDMNSPRSIAQTYGANLEHSQFYMGAPAGDQMNLIPLLRTDGIIAFSKAEVYFERAGNTTEPPNLMNPCWNVRLAPLDREWEGILDKVPGLNGILGTISDIVPAQLSQHIPLRADQMMPH